MSSEELKPCPFCGGDVSFHKDDECPGCHLIQCGQCRAFFDFATGADPGNDCESVDALRSAIAPMWNRRAQLAAIQGGMGETIEPCIDLNHHERYRAGWNACRAAMLAAAPAPAQTAPAVPEGWRLVMAIELAEEKHGSLRAAARALGIDAGYLSRLKKGEKVNPSEEVLAALGLERMTMYRASQQCTQSSWVPDGWQLVPKEPTAEMIETLAASFWPADWEAGKRLQRLRGTKVVFPKTEIEMAVGKYERMLAAAPAQPAAQEGESK